MIILSKIKGIQSGKEDLINNVVSNDRGVCRSESTVNNLYSHWSTTCIAHEKDIATCLEIGIL